MLTVLAFGDSLTWGTNAALGARHRFEVRWPNVLQTQLGSKYHVVAEGLGGRTTIYDDPDSPVDRNGSRALPILLGSHNPLDLVIIMLGANDLKPTLCGRAEGAAEGMGRLVDIVETYPYNWGVPAPRVLLVSPPHFCNRTDGSGPEGGRSIPESQKLADAYASLAERRNLAFFDAAQFANASAVDGVHLDAENTSAIGRGLAPVVKSLLGS